MKYARECECCWHKITARTEQLNARRVQALWKLIETWNKTKLPVKTSDLDLWSVWYSTFSKLKHFWLMYEVNGWRLPTEKGLLFWQWKIQCENRSVNFWNKTLSLDHEARLTDKKWRKLVWIWDVNADYKWKQKAEYQAENTPNMKSLFSIS